MLKPDRLLAVVALAAIVALGPRAAAQEVKIVTAEAAGPVVKVEGAPASPAPEGTSGRPDRRRMDPDGKPLGEPGKPGSEPPKDAKPGEAKPGESKPEEPPSVSRPTKPPKPPDPKELAVRPDAEGRLSFNFRGQPWPAVLEWLAEVSGMSLDWQELPGDFLNLSTQRSYTVRETRDLINRHLLARGYTLLSQGEVLSVVQIKKLNPGLVPRVDPDALAARDPYEFVKVSFPLDWMVAESAVEELKPMLSPNGKLTPLRTTNRIEAMDAVVNLREIHALLSAEQSDQGQERLVREFVLEYARASDVQEQLRTLVGMEPPSGAPMRGPGGPGQPSPEMQQRMMMMAQGGPGGPGQPQPGQPQPGGPPKARAEVYLVVNARKNSIVAVAPPDKMAIIAEAVKRLDAPMDRDASLSTTMNRVHVYRLASIDPEAIVKTLEELGNLDPTTRLQVDKKNRAIVANAPPWDHVMIRTLLQKLDGSERQFEVIQLRRLPADYVAGTIEFMMGGEKPKESRRSPYYYPFDFFGGDRRGQTDESQSKFRVEADVENNRLLLKANPIELEEVKQLLVKLGETPAGSGRSSTVRTLDLPPGKQTDELLERVRRRWSTIAPNPLVLPAPSPEEKPAEKEKEKPSIAPGGKTPEKPPRSAGPAGAAPGAPLVAMLQIGEMAAAAPMPGGAWRASGDGAAGDKPRPEEPAPATSAGPEKPPLGEKPGGAPPVTVTRDPNGELIVSSPDTEALDRFEDLVAQSAPASPADFRIFKLQYAWASGVATILRDVFKEDKKEERRSPWYYDYDYYYSSREDTWDKDRARLSKRRPLKIISESDTNSILVQGADAGQLRQIEELIKFYDRAEPTDAQSVRKTQTFRLQHSQAKVVAETIKDVYRDLLSANDKALATNQPQRPERSYSFFFSDDSDKAEKTPKFKGLLSVGVDDLSNTIVVSAPAYLMEGISKIVEELDEAAEPAEDTMTVVNLGNGAAAPQVKEALARVLGQGGSDRAGRSKPGETPSPKPERRRGRRSGESSNNRSR